MGEGGGNSLYIEKYINNAIPKASTVSTWWWCRYNEPTYNDIHVLVPWKRVLNNAIFNIQEFIIIMRPDAGGGFNTPIFTDTHTHHYDRKVC